MNQYQRINNRCFSKAAEKQFDIHRCDYAIITSISSCFAI